MADTHTDEIFNVYGALDNLNKRMKSVENKVPDYTADMLEVYRNLGALTKRIAELEELVTNTQKTALGGEEMDELEYEKKQHHYWHTAFCIAVSLLSATWAGIIFWVLVP